MRRTTSLGALALLVVTWLVALAPAAHAAGAPITRMDVKASLSAKGTMTVTQTLDMQFSGSGNHGPYLYFTTRQAIEGDPAHWRVLRYTITSVTSPTGAPARWQTERPDAGTLALRVGDPNRTVNGLQTYVVTYTVEGVVNPKVEKSQMDEVFWNVIGTGWTVPISDVTVSLTSPAAVSQTQCWAGARFDQPCTSNAASGTTATYTQETLNRGQGLAVVGGWPMGTFDATPIIEERTVPVSPFQVTPLTAGATAALSLAVVGFMAFRVRRDRDEAYAGLTPGLRPAPGSEGTIGKATRTPVAVQFTPPAGLRPGMVGTLIDETADVRDVTATIIDMAVRGYLRLEQDGPKDSAVRLVRLAPPQGLLPYEKALYTDIFPGRSDVATSSQLEARGFGETMKFGQTQLYEAVTEAGFFKTNPQSARSAWVAIAVVLGAATVFFGGTLLARGWGLLIPPFILAAVGALMYSKFAPVRTAEGTAANAQAQGFRQYLQTAEADQIKWEEGEDIFSRYLPYAIAFGCADRWAAVFKELAARGVALPQPTWYYSPYGWGYGSGYDIGRSVDSMMSSLDGFSSQAASAMQAPSAGSSGGSGFSSGGFSGGGGGGIGGGGGGSW